MIRAIVLGRSLPVLVPILLLGAVPARAEQAAGAEGAAEEAPAAHTGASKREKKPRRVLPRPVVRGALADGVRLQVPAQVILGAGWLRGEGYRDQSGPMISGEVDLRPELRLREPHVVLRLPLSHRRRETLGFELAEHETDLGLEALWRPAERWEAEAGLALRWLDRPSWPDAYQPVLVGGEPTGAVLGTDRFSRFEWGLRAGVGLRTQGGIRLRLRVEALTRTYTKDPVYDPVARPDHLVPGDFTRLGTALRAERRVWDGRWRQRLELRGEVYGFAEAYARDAGTGRTHAAPGGPPPNPLLAYDRFTLEHRSSVLFPGTHLRLVGSLALVHNADTFEGYYNWNAIAAALAVRVPIGYDLKAELSWSGLARGYTDAGYQAGGSHLPLDGGATIRGETLNALSGRVTWDAWRAPGRSRGRVRPFVEASYLARSTNFPDYVPDLNPPGSPYDVPFDYVNLVVWGGVEARI